MHILHVSCLHEMRIQKHNDTEEKEQEREGAKKKMRKDNLTTHLLNQLAELSCSGNHRI